jgi:hypothetical protein
LNPSVQLSICWRIDGCQVCTGARKVRAVQVRKVPVVSKRNPRAGITIDLCTPGNLQASHVPDPRDSRFNDARRS